jgi:hypothetical protein
MARRNSVLKPPPQERDREGQIARNRLSMLVSRGTPFCQEVCQKNFAASPK